MQKEYTKPTVSRVSLVPSEAVLSGCKTSLECTIADGSGGCLQSNGLYQCKLEGS